MLPEVVAAVRDLAAEGRARFRASHVAELANVNVDQARRDLVALSKAGELRINYELLCPGDSTTLTVFHESDEIPTEYSAWDCNGGEPFDVTPELIWVTFTPTDALREQVANEPDSVAEGPPAGKRLGPRRRRVTRARTGSRTTSKRPKLH